MASRNVGTLLRTFNSDNPNVGAPLDIKSFLMLDTDDKLLRKLVLLNSSNYMYFVGQSASDYTVVKNSTNLPTYDQMDVVQAIQVK